ncbi:MAG TPA: hypothetical protein VHM91_12985 [Verrucomicrobiales bacterium]|nr:hypothetical protein [Verrucomicrobiales bacterium]
MRKTGYLALAVLIAAGFSVYWGLSAAQRAEGGRGERRVSKAFQYLKEGQRAAERRAGTAGKRASGAENVQRMPLREVIARYREDAYLFLTQQRETIKGITDPEAKKAADYTRTTGNQLMLAAVVTEMSRSPEYAEQLAGMLQEEVFRGLLVSLPDYFPALGKHVAEGGSIDAANVATLFPQDRDFLSEFDQRIASALPPDEAASFENGIAHWLAADLLAWQAYQAGDREAGEGAYFWEGARRSRE